MSLSDLVINKISILKSVPSILFLKSSQDGDGKVGFDEFSALMSSTARGHSDSSL